MTGTPTGDRPAPVALALNTASTWRDMGYGLAFLMREADAVSQELAQGAAQEAMAKLAAGEVALATYGLDDRARPSLADPQVVLGLAETLWLVELASLVVEDWNWADVEGAPVPLDRRGFMVLFRSSQVRTAFANAVQADQVLTVAEKNASAAGPSGDGQAAMSTAPGASPPTPAGAA